MNESETEEVKPDFNVYNKMSICQACLSSDRKLTLLQEYLDIYIKIIDNSNTVLPSSIYLCWECVAILKKIITFKRKVENAQAILNYVHMNKLPPINLHSQSSLKIVKTDNNKNIINIIHENVNNLETKSIEVEIKEIDLNIKDELDDAYFDNTYNGIDNNIDSDYTYVTDIKKEIQNAPLKIENLIKKNKNNITKKITLKEHYRVILQEDKPKKELRKRIQIKPVELEFWLKKERDSEYYKSLTFKCDKCICGWRTKSKLEIHNKKYHNKNFSYACDLCDTRHSSKLALTRHVIKHYYVERCTICQYCCYSSSHMRWHVGLHRKSIQCLYCDACFHNTRLFHDHYRCLHTIFLCDLCGKRCKSKRMLEKHISRHQKNECKICNKTFKSASILRYHVNLKHVVQSTEEAYCVQCDRQFINVNTYRRHLHSSAAHASERNAKVKKKFSCSECGNVYSRHVYMMNHYRHVHMKQSKHYCSECDRHFLNRTRYIDHMRYKHEGMKKAKNKICNICGRGFAVNRTLINHIRTHSGERPFECEYCKARFTQKHAMLSHVKYIHLKAKRRTCWQE